MVGPTSRYQHPAVGEQCRRVEQPTIIKVACDRPIAGGRIVNFRACESGVWKNTRTWSRATRDQHSAIIKQRRRVRRSVISPRMIHTAGKLPLKGSSDTG